MCDNGSTIIQSDNIDDTPTIRQDFKVQSRRYSSSNSLLSSIAFFLGSLVVIVFLSICVYEKIESINEPVRKLNPEYRWPCVSDFLDLFWQLPMTVVTSFHNKISYPNFSLKKSQVFSRIN